MGKEYKYFKGKNQRVRIFKLTFVCLHHLIKSMRKCLRKAIYNDGGPIYYLQFVLLYWLMPVFVLNDCLFFLYFAISSNLHFYHLNSLNFRDCMSGMINEWQEQR